jgi:hypothetical protein
MTWQLAGGCGASHSQVDPGSEKDKDKREGEEVIRRLALLATLVMTLGAGAGFATSAQATTGSNGATGVCDGDYCWGVISTGYVTNEVRDIAGNPNQQFNEDDIGTVNQLDQADPACFTGSWWQQFDSSAVYTFTMSSESSYYPFYYVESPGNELSVHEGRSPLGCNPLWIWTGSHYAYNVANSDYWNSPQGVENAPENGTLETGTSPYPWLDPHAREFRR